MKKRKERGIEWYEYDIFSTHKNLRHATFLRRGGTSSDEYTSLNTAYDVGDNSIYVTENLSRIKSLLNTTNLVWAKQVHATKIIPITSPHETIPECDAFMTSTPGVALMIKHADCQAAIFYDPRNKAYAVVHAGWRGTVQNIYATTINAMVDSYDTDPEELLVAISPSLGPDAACFENYREELPEVFWPYQEKPLYFNFWEISRMQLENAGIQPHNIEIAGVCTYGNEEDFFSYRRDKVTGRHATVAMLC